MYIFIFSTHIGKVEVSGGLDNIVKLVKAEILNQQNIALWDEEDTPIFRICPCHLIQSLKLQAFLCYLSSRPQSIASL